MEFIGSYDEVFIAAFVITGIWALSLIDKRFGHRFNDDECLERLAELEQGYEKRIAELEGRITWLVVQLQRASVPIPLPVRTDVLPTKPLLLVVGPAQDIYAEDREALRRARIPFQRLVNATKHTISSELRARRQDGTLYPWIHVSSHAGEDGIELADGLSSAEWWQNQLDGVKVIFLAACRTDHVASALAGLVTVVYTSEDIENEIAGDLTYAFWRRMREHGDPRRAYNQAIQECPQAAEYTNIRER